MHFYLLLHWSVPWSGPWYQYSTCNSRKHYCNIQLKEPHSDRQRAPSPKFSSFRSIHHKTHSLTWSLAVCLCVWVLRCVIVYSFIVHDLFCFLRVLISFFFLFDFSCFFILDKIFVCPLLLCWYHGNDLGWFLTLVPHTWVLLHGSLLYVRFILVIL